MMIYGYEPGDACRARRTQSISNRRAASHGTSIGERHPWPAGAQAIAGFPAPYGPQGCWAGGGGAARATAALQTTRAACEAASQMARSLPVHLGTAVRATGRADRGN